MCMYRTLMDKKQSLGGLGTLGDNSVRKICPGESDEEIRPWGPSVEAGGIQ